MSEIDQETAVPEVSAFEDSTVDESLVTEAVNNDTHKTHDKPRGFKTYEEWIKEGRDPEEFKGVKAYEKEGERFEALMRTQKDLKEVKDLATKLWEQQQKIEEASYKKAYDDLRSQAISAAEIADVETVRQTTDKLIELQNNKPISKPPISQGMTPEDIFSAKNPWFSNPQTREDHLKIAEAKYEDVQIAKEFAAKGIHLTVQQHLDILQERISKTHVAADVKKTIITQSGNDIAGSPSDANTWTKQIPAAHKKIIRDIERMTGKNFTLADTKAYVNRLKLTGEIK